jgi:c-di-GMP-binding flagellar brake protein YcgR
VIDWATVVHKHTSTLREIVDPGVEERRDSPRISWSTEIVLVLLQAFEATEEPLKILNAETQNIARGGIGMVCSSPIPPGVIVRCEIALANQVGRIPTLLKVRWTNLLEEQKLYRMGLQFLF